MSERYMIVGLGNPGREYENTRHNIGFGCVEAIAEAYRISFDRKKQSKAKIADGMIQGRRVLLVKPQTFMNLSGSSVQGLATFYKIRPENILVIFDDLDIPLGTLRIRPKGGSGGHRGMTDIIARLGTQEFPRVRFGIGRPPGRMDPAAYVLRPFVGEESRIVADTVDRVIRAIELWLSDGIEAMMNQYNGATGEEEPVRSPDDRRPSTPSE